MHPIRLNKFVFPRTVSSGQHHSMDMNCHTYLGHSPGARSCLGRRFFEVEAVAILTVLIMRYKVEVKEEPQFASETFEQRKARILAGKPGLTLTWVFHSICRNSFSFLHRRLSSFFHRWRLSWSNGDLLMLSVDRYACPWYSSEGIS